VDPRVKEWKMGQQEYAPEESEVEDDGSDSDQYASMRTESASDKLQYLSRGLKSTVSFTMFRSISLVHASQLTDLPEWTTLPSS
jgi:hypothetical protein